MSSTGILNTSGETLTLPAPYAGVLKAGQMAVVTDGYNTVLANLLSSWGSTRTEDLFRTVKLIVAPTTTGRPNGPPIAPTVHGLANLDETVAGPTAACNLAVRTTRVDLVGGGGSCTATLGPGIFSGQRHWVEQISATGSAAVNIAGQFSEGRVGVRLTALNAWACLEWQALGASGASPSGAGWKLSSMGSPTGAGVALV